MLKSVFATVVAAAVVAAKNTTYECSPVVSGTLQSWFFNSTGVPTIVGANATKSGEYLKETMVTEPLEVVFERCEHQLKHQNATALVSNRVTLKNKDLCVAHERAGISDDRKLLLAECAQNDEERRKQEFHLLYGKGMKGQNATLMVYHPGRNGSVTLPFLGIFAKSRHDTNSTVAGMTSWGMELLQIGNPKEH
mgnify:CR=1 FL=1